MAALGQVANINSFALLRQSLDAVRYYVQAANQYIQTWPKKIAEELPITYLRRESPILRDYGRVCLLIGLITPFWHVSPYDWNGLWIRRNENGWGFGPISSYNTGFMLLVLIYESLGCLLAFAPSRITPVLQHFLHRLPREKVACICPVFDGPLVLTGCILCWVQPMEGARVSISLLLSFFAGILLLPSGILELMTKTRMNDS